MLLERGDSLAAGGDRREEPTFGVNNDHNVAVWFSGPEWAIFQEDTTGMTLGASFNVAISSR